MAVCAGSRSQCGIDDTGYREYQALGEILYTQYGFVFQVSGLVLLVAMVGAIVLTHRRRPGVRSQKVGDQVSRKPSDAMEIKSIVPGAGA